MKYEVIGWTSEPDDWYPPHDTITASVDAAIIKEIRKHKYLFGGDAHEHYCPVLNDGTLASYSWRGWGRIIALSYGEEGEYAYMCGYMDSLIKPKARKYPELGFPKDHLIVPREKLAEVIEMRLSDDMFEAVRAGTKTVEIRLFDKKRQQVDLGDYIAFTKASDPTQRILRKVTDIRIATTFERLLGEVDYRDDSERKLRYPPVSLGCPENADLTAAVEGMYRYYTKEQEKEHGAIAIFLEEPKPVCTTYFGVYFDNKTKLKLYEEKLSDPDLPQEEFIRILDDEDMFDREKIKSAVEEVSDRFDEFANWLRFGLNPEYDPDVNVMLRQTLKDLFGKEDRLREIQEKYFVSMRLEIYTTFITDSKEPKQNLKIDSDIRNFLKKAGAKLKKWRRTV